MYCFQIVQIIVYYINTNAKVQTGVTPIDDFEISKLKIANLSDICMDFRETFLIWHTWLFTASLLFL